MGSSKKSKDKDKEKSREHKKKRHRTSRSRSRERKHSRRDRSRERDPYRREKDSKRKHEDPYDDQAYTREYESKYDSVYIPGLGDPYAAAENDNYGHYEDGELSGARMDIPVKEEIEFKEEKPTVSTNSGDVSLSIDETNALRAKLGLKPLEMDTGGDEEKKKKEDVHVPAVNISQVKKSEDLKKKLLAAKEKRRINAILGKVKTLGEDSGDEDDVASWVKKMKKQDKEKKMAEKRAKLLEEMDNEFGIGDLVDHEFGVKKEYTSRDLKGLKVQHSGTSFKEGKTIVLTLDDKMVLDEEAEDTLVNVNLVDDERAAKNVENKKTKGEYKPYDDEFDEFGMPKQKNLLGKYDEVIDGDKKESFKLSATGKYSGSKEKIREEIREQAEQNRIALTLPAPVVAAEFFTEEEMAFKKVKRKVRKIRKKVKTVKADDLLPLPEDVHSKPIDAQLAHMIDKSAAIPGLDFVKKDEDDDFDIDGPEQDMTGVAIEDEAMNELQSAIEKTRKIKQKKKVRNPEKVAENLISQKSAVDDEFDEDDDNDVIGDVDMPNIGKSQIVLNQTSEFCRTLGDIPTYGQSGNRLEDEDEIMDFEQEQPMEDQDDVNNPGWQEVDIGDNPVKIDSEEKAVLDEEPVVGLGVAAALSLASKKGYLSDEKLKQPTAKRHLGLEAENYSIEDKRYDDLDEKYRKRDRFVGGMVSEFKEKDGYKPNVKLDYVDDTGRFMSPKEAFRFLSHSFHGKGSGKMKTEKRKKKIEEENLMKSMSSTDTPLGTAAMLEEKLSRQKTPYLQLSGGNKTFTSADRISK